MQDTSPSPLSDSGRAVPTASPVEQRATQFAPAAGDAAPPSELKTFGAAYLGIWALVLVLAVVVRRKLDQVLDRADRLEKAATAPGQLRR